MPTRKSKSIGGIEGSVLALDTETTGLNPYHGHRIFCWSFYSNLAENECRHKTRQQIEFIKRILNDPTKTIVFQNAKFDLKMLYFEGVDIFNIKADVHCTLLMSKVLDSVLPDHNLKVLAKRHLGISAEAKDQVDEWIKKNSRKFNNKYDRKPNFQDVPYHLIEERAKWDAKSTYRIFRKLYKRVMEVCPDLYNTERELMYVCIDMENQGVLIDITRAEQLKREAESSVKLIQNELNRVACPLRIIKKKRGEPYQEVVHTLNTGSSKIQLPAAFQKLGIKLKYKTEPKKNKYGRMSGGGNWAFDEYAMIRYVSDPIAAIIRDSSEEGWTGRKFYNQVMKAAQQHQLEDQDLFPALILKLREVQKMISTYYDHFVNDCMNVKVEPNGRKTGVLHCKFNQDTAMTGRFSSSNVNLQNQPRKLGPRECFIVRKGRYNWHFDYEQVEMRFFVHFSNDQTMAAAIDDDIHLTVASEVYHKPKDDVTKEQRKRAKGVNFGIIYGAGAKTIGVTLTKKGLPTSTIQSKSLVGEYHRKFPSVKKTTARLKRELLSQGYVENPFGRQYRIPTRLSYKALNYMCQGTSADLMKRAMVDIWKWLRKNTFRSKIIMTVHDEIVLEIIHSEAKVIVPKVMSIMEELERFNIPIRVAADVVTKRWSKKCKPSDIGFQMAA
jgi:DNA polymerase I-like protein with 3'-5' exonuclease and polymerase domains